MRHNKDILWKGLLELVFDDLLRFVFPNADHVFDLQREFTFLDKELAEMYPEPEKGSDVRVVDKLVKVFRKDGAEEWLLVHIEIQDKTKARDRDLFPERMFRYFYRCFDRYSVRLFLANTEFSVEKIASLVGVPVTLVKKLAKEVRAK